MLSLADGQALCGICQYSEQVDASEDGRLYGTYSLSFKKSARYILVDLARMCREEAEIAKTRDLQYTCGFCGHSVQKGGAPLSRFFNDSAEPYYRNADVQPFCQNCRSWSPMMIRNSIATIGVTSIIPIGGITRRSGSRIGSVTALSACTTGPDRSIGNQLNIARAKIAKARIWTSKPTP